MTSDIPDPTTTHDSEHLRRLLQVMARLRDPDRGCPWDVAQDFSTIAPHTIEEAYEVADAIERRHMDDLVDELGDLLFQVVFHARMAEEAGHFDFDDVARAIVEKMVRRHPHVFGDESVDDAAAQTVNWETHKARERADKAAAEGRTTSVLDGVVPGLPAMTRALKLQKRAARVGFDWPDLGPVLAKVREELDELEAEVAQPEPSRDRLHDELGDLLFVTVNLARHLEVDPEAALRSTNEKFVQRFQYIEDALSRSGRSAEDSDLEEMDALWDEAKTAARKG